MALTKRNSSISIPFLSWGTSFLSRNVLYRSLPLKAIFMAWIGSELYCTHHWAFERKFRNVHRQYYIHGIISTHLWILNPLQTIYNGSFCQLNTRISGYCIVTVLRGILGQGEHEENIARTAAWMWRESPTPMAINTHTKKQRKLKTIEIEEL